MVVFDIIQSDGKHAGHLRCQLILSLNKYDILRICILRHRSVGKTAVCHDIGDIAHLFFDILPRFTDLHEITAGNYDRIVIYDAYRSSYGILHLMDNALKQSARHIYLLLLQRRISSVCNTF